MIIKYNIMAVYMLLKGFLKQNKNIQDGCLQKYLFAEL